MAHLNKELAFIEQHLLNYKDLNVSVSKVSVGWHLNHNLLVINSVCKVLLASKPSHFKSSINWYGRFFLWMNYIPRGLGKAPKAVLSDENIALKEIERRLTYSYENLLLVKQLPKNSHFEHPYFGSLNLKQSLKFLEVHTRHHNKIIRDILNKD